MSLFDHADFACQGHTSFIFGIEIASIFVDFQFFKSQFKAASAASQANPFPSVRG
jgi:hypothetical protein